MPETVLEPRHGRPPRSGVRATERIEFVVTTQEKAALKQVADDFGKDVATVVRDAVNEFVADYSDRIVFRHYRTLPRFE